MTDESLQALGSDRALEMYRLGVITRKLDLEAVAMQRQGLIPGYAPMRGQEAAQIASAAALDPMRDFAFPTYRELGVAATLGVDLIEYMSTHLATWHGALYDPAATRFAPINAVVAGSVLHAMGWAKGETLAGRDGVAITYFGDGASSQGDVHESMNFAGVARLPVIYFCQNNGWAISVPTDRQVAGGSVAARAEGYGIHGVRIDGNDFAAVHIATTEAVARARRGDGPTVIEAMTYRIGPHSTSDDPGRYRSLEEEREWSERDPLTRFEVRLRAAGILDDSMNKAIEEEARETAERTREGVIALQARPIDEMFDFVFQELTPELIEQREVARKGYFS